MAKREILNRVQNDKYGFTLVEILVVVGLTGVMLVAVVGVMLNSFRIKNRTENTNKLEQNASWAMMELKRNILAAVEEGMTCPTGYGTSISFNNSQNGQSTTLNCAEGKIASESANRADLTNVNEVTVSDCSQFVTCSDGLVEFRFTLTIGATGDTVENRISKTYELKTAVRNRIR